MSKKDFKAGMVAGAKPFEVKFREVQNANIAALQKLASENANEVGELIDIAEEHEYLLNYNWKRECQLGSLAEKSILIGFLMDAIDKISSSESSDTQREFLNSIYRFLKLNISALFSKRIDISYLSNNNDVAFQKLLYLLTCMYFYIGDENFYFLDNNPDVFDYFNVSPRDRKEIQGLIEERASYFDFNLLFTSKEEETVEEITQEEDNTVGCNLPENLETITFSELHWVKANTEEVIADKNINIKSNLQIDGKLTFKNCRILYDEKDDFQINVTNSGTIVFDNCEFPNLQQTKKYLIQSNGKVNFTHCTMVNCWQLAKFSGNFSEESTDIEINKSEIRFNEDFAKKNYGTALFYGGKISLVASEVKNWKTPTNEELNKCYSGQWSYMLYGNLICRNCVFNNCFRIFSPYSNRNNISDSTFIYCKNIFQLLNDCKFRYRGGIQSICGCHFIRCEHIFAVSTYARYSEIQIENSNFSECLNIERLMILSGKVSIMNCEFRNISQIVERRSLILLNRPDCSSLYMNSCVFDNITLADYGTVIENRTSSDKDALKFCGTVKNCTFGRISAYHIIEKYGCYIGAFNKVKYYLAYSITNCTGLD